MICIEKTVTDKRFDVERKFDFPTKKKLVARWQ